MRRTAVAEEAIGLGVGVALEHFDGADLRSSKDEGQSNFINPGLFLAGVGADMDLTPELRLSTNFNYLSIADTATLDPAATFALRTRPPVSKKRSNSTASAM